MTIFTSIVAALLVIATAQTPAPPPVPPKLALALEAHVQLGTPIELGQVPRGRRRIIPIVGGTFEGSGIKGKVLNNGADWHADVQGPAPSDAFTIDGDFDGANNGDGYTVFPDAMKLLAAVNSNTPTIMLMAINRPPARENKPMITNTGATSSPR